MKRILILVVFTLMTLLTARPGLAGGHPHLPPFLPFVPPIFLPPLPPLLLPPLPPPLLLPPLPPVEISLHVPPVAFVVGGHFRGAYDPRYERREIWRDHRDERREIQQAWRDADRGDHRAFRHETRNLHREYRSELNTWRQHRRGHDLRSDESGNRHEYYGERPELRDR